MRMSGALKRSRMVNLRHQRMSWREPNPRTPPCQWPVLTRDRAVIACARYESTYRRLHGRPVIARILFLLVMLGWPALGRAQTPEAPSRLEPVVVTPSRLEQQAGEAPASVTVITADDVRSAPYVALDDLLRQIPSFSLFRRSSSLVGHPTTQGVSLRGVGPSGASRALVLVDGIPINDPFGGWVPWSRVPLLSIEQIEVVRGGGSALWGNGALGGVINVISRPPIERSAIFESSLGNHDTKNFDLLVRETLGPWRLNPFTTVDLTSGARSRNRPTSSSRSRTSSSKPTPSRARQTAS